MQDIIGHLALKAIKLAGSNTQEMERFCWMIVHEHRHGVKPTEYDIREIDEDLYLRVLNYVKESKN